MRGEVGEIVHIPKMVDAVLAQGTPIKLNKRDSCLCG